MAVPHILQTLTDALGGIGLGRQVQELLFISESFEPGVAFFKQISPVDFHRLHLRGPQGV